MTDADARPVSVCRVNSQHPRTTRRPSGPELRAARLIARLNLALESNDGSGRAEPILLRADGKGTSVIRDKTLYTDAPARNDRAARPKNFCSITPDYLGECCFVEVKDDVSGTSWERLCRDALNDNLRFALLRMRAGAIDDMRIEYGKLDCDLRRIAAEALAPFPRSPPEERVYLRWDHLKRCVPSPDENLEPAELKLSGRRMPIKAITGVKVDGRRLYILDSAVMSQWEVEIR